MLRSWRGHSSYLHAKGSAASSAFAELLSCAKASTLALSLQAIFNSEAASRDRAREAFATSLRAPNVDDVLRNARRPEPYTSISCTSIDQVLPLCLHPHSILHGQSHI